jgi:hypothetical protein
MKSKHNYFTRGSAFGAFATRMFGARVVNELFRKTEQNRSSLAPIDTNKPCEIFVSFV